MLFMPKYDENNIIKEIYLCTYYQKIAQPIHLFDKADKAVPVHF